MGESIELIFVFNHFDFRINFGGPSTNLTTSPVHFKPGDTLRQKVVHPKDQTLRHELDHVVCAVPCHEDFRQN